MSTQELAVPVRTAKALYAGAVWLQRNSGGEVGSFLNG